jgi:hypothetical protein
MTVQTEKEQSHSKPPQTSWHQYGQLRRPLIQHLKTIKPCRFGRFHPTSDTMTHLKPHIGTEKGVGGS